MVVAGVLVVAAILLAIVQIASDGFAAPAAASVSFVSHMPHAFAMRVYTLLDRIAPAPYVELTLAHAALERGDAGAAERSALRLPASAVRNELLADIARARGKTTLAFEYFFAAPDVAEVQREILGLAPLDPVEAYAREQQFRQYLMMLATHPDALADAFWIGGNIAQMRAGRVAGAQASAWSQRALTEYETALQLAPLDMKYVLAAANQALTMRDLPTADRLYHTGIDVDPSSGQAFAGAGIVAADRGDRGSARQYAAHARALAPDDPLVHALDRLLGT